MMTSSTEALSTPARESAAVMAAAPSAGALTLLSAPPNAPTAVRAAAMSLGLAAWMEVLTNRNTSSQFTFVLSSILEETRTARNTSNISTGGLGAHTHVLEKNWAGGRERACVSTDAKRKSNNFD